MINIIRSNSSFMFHLNKNIYQTLKRCLRTSLISNSNISLESKLSHSENNLIQEVKNHSTKLIKVSLIGLPNAGKSSIINKISRRMICPISSKVHTTQKKARAIISEDNIQIVFLDTPGLVGADETKKHHLNRNYVLDSEKSINESDIIGIVHDVSNMWLRDKLDHKILRLIYLHPNKNYILILNKVDKIKNKKTLLEITSTLTCDSLDSTKKVVILPNLSETQVNKIIQNQKGWPAFSHTFMVSALNGCGIEDLKEYLKLNAKPSPFLYKNPTIFTDQSPKQLIIETVRAKLLENLPQEIPYNLLSEIEYFHVTEEGSLVASVLVNCSSLRIEKLIIGSKGGRIRKIAEAVEQDLSKTFNCPVIIRIIIISPQDKKN